LEEQWDGAATELQRLNLQLQLWDSEQPDYADGD
jgi:hypothetical protein